MSDLDFSDRCCGKVQKNFVVAANFIQFLADVVYLLTVDQRPREEAVLRQLAVYCEVLGKPHFMNTTRDCAMDKDKLETYLGGFKGSEKSFPFGPEALVFKVMGKMFALVSQGEEIPRVTLKCDPLDAAQYVDQFASVVPGYYMNKKHWVTISLTGELPEEMLTDLARGSYELVAKALSKADQKKLGLNQ
jgi:predicted DNA-binding protein (MmcQ/YjbR family)